MSNIGALGIPLDFPISESLARTTAIIEARNLPIVRDFEKRLLADIRFQSIRGKQIASGTGASLIWEHHIIAWWTWRANDKGPVTADRELEHYLASDQIETWNCLWLYGINTADTIEVSKDLYLVPLQQMPYSAYRVDLGNQAVSSLGAWSPTPKVALVKKTLVSKLYDGPSNYRTSLLDRLYCLPLLLNLLPGVNASVFCHRACYPDGTPPGDWAGGGASGPILDVVPRRESFYANPENINLDELISAFLQKGKPEQSRLRIALQRIQAAKSRMYAPANQALDLGIALESLLLENSKGDQLSLTFRLRGAWFIGKTAEERSAYFKTLHEIYKLRSEVAHSGGSKTLAGSSPYEDKLSHHFRLAEKIARKAILEPSPDWDRLILGHGSPMI